MDVGEEGKVREDVQWCARMPEYRRMWITYRYVRLCGSIWVYVGENDWVWMDVGRCERM